MIKKWNLFIVLLAVLMMNCSCAKKQEQSSLSKEMQSTSSEMISEESKVDCMVYVCGAVANPGVYQLEEGSRICDAIECAGGMQENAAGTYLNLAALIEDGMKIYVPTTEEAQTMQQEEIHSSSVKININTADESQLVQLPGIGQTRARQIIAYREEFGTFSRIEDLMKVPGIKESIFEKLESLISVGK